ncbi:glycerophosphodiester phosphodiesterase 1-like isoform X2 [Halictus rubicundus]|uniref:glycerophosphodiester phosphodiesterase 1-like isoform X2 n=1 Tax=Halictus rubicundus TaxID=77578 RepID=UPI0040356674
MHGFVELILCSASLWILLQTIWSIVISVFYNFCVPWIMWGTLIILIGLKVARIPQPNLQIRNEVLGVNPLLQKKDNNVPKDHGNGDQFCMRVVAHRGGAYDYPENSLTAFRNSKKKGCKAVEIDLCLTKDNVPIVFHDPSIDRVTGRAGSIRDMTWDQLKELDITHNHPLKDKFDGNENIPSLEHVLDTCLNQDQRIIIDIKETGTEVVQTVLDAYNKYPKLYQRGIISSFNPIFIYMIRRKNPKIVTSLAWRPQYFSRTSFSAFEKPGPPRFNNPIKHMAACLLDHIYEWALYHFVYYVAGVSVVLLHKDTINQYVIQNWYNRGVRVMAWTVNLPSEKLHISRLLKVTYLTDTLLHETDM